MKVLLKIFVKFIILNICLAQDLGLDLCPDAEGLVSIFASLSGNPFDFKVDFTFASEKNREPVNIAVDDWTVVENKSFDPSKKTFIIIHGYLSHGKKPWILQMKDAILDLEASNVIIADWSKGLKLNYVTCIKNAPAASNQIASFLHQLRQKLHDNNTPSDIKWNQLHFIGHSLGSHISGQAAYKISKATPPFEKFSSFFQIKRITGLDPAKPCFKSSTPAILRLDKDDADFVDIIHTQASEKIFSLGTDELIGHLDFFVNGGHEQPECIGFISIRPKEMVCSHQSACRYFIDSIKTAKAGQNACRFSGFPWDGSIDGAKAILNVTLKDNKCEGCSEMGIRASKGTKDGRFLVVTASKSPYCEYTKKDEEFVIRSLEKMEKAASLNLSTIYSSDEFNDFFTEP